MPQQPGLLTDPIGFLREGAEQNAARAGKDEFGNQKDPGWFNNFIGSVTGATDEGTQEYVQAAKNHQNETKFKPQIEALGGTFTPGLTPGQYGSEIDRLTQARNNNAYTNSPAGKQAAQQFALQTEQIAQQGKRLDQQMTMALMDRADAKEQRASELEYQKLRDRKEDRRYNENIERLDAKDRKMAMQSIAAGLASLGAAFAM